LSDFALKFLTRPGCHLCDDARPLVESAAEREGVGFEEVDVDSSPELKSMYGTRVPVLLGSDGMVIAEGVIDDRRQLRKRIKRSARATG
jgi:thiol-disulfide isomerase/thioredoxin